jgi:hypothetical protein
MKVTRCLAVKKKGSTQQCTSHPLKGHTLCGTHARAKTVQVWKDVQVVDHRVVVCQSVARKWAVLHRLRFGGPGVLKRKDLANDDELVSGEESNRQHPFEYFAFTENGKIWWFDFGTIWTWSLKSLTPSNPYTKVPLDKATRQRLRDFWSYRIRNHIKIPFEPEDVDERLNTRLNFLCQTFIDHGFTDVEPRQIANLSKQSHMTMWKFLFEDVANIEGPLRGWCRYMLARQITTCNTLTYVINSLRILMRYVTEKKEAYCTVFSVMSAIYRC